jgi:hypothetical protein
VNPSTGRLFFSTSSQNVLAQGRLFGRQVSAEAFEGMMAEKVLEPAAF